MADACGASLYVYGSVANGTVRPGRSDVDLLSVGLADPCGVGKVLSGRYADLCRGVEVSAFTAAGLAGDCDAAHGDRVFLRHYCVHLAGPDPSAALPAYPADARAAPGRARSWPGQRQSAPLPPAKSGGRSQATGSSPQSSIASPA